MTPKIRKEWPSDFNPPNRSFKDLKGSLIPLSTPFT